MTCSKKHSILAILKILQDKTDIDHHITYDKISELLESDYGIKFERRAVARNIKTLIEFGYDIEIEHDGSYIVSKEFEDDELKLLIDNVLSNKFITAGFTKKIIGKLKDQSSQSLRRHISYVEKMDDWSKTPNPAVLINIGEIDKAIASNKQISFDYLVYDETKKLVLKHPEYKCVCSPYRMVVKNQRYYLMSQNSHRHALTYYKIDKIRNIEILDVNSDDINDLPSFTHGVNNQVLSDALPYMFSDAPKTIRIELKKDEFIDTVIDWFGTKVKLSRGTNGKYVVELKSSPLAMKYWALQYVDEAKVLTPPELVQDVKEELKKGLAYYDM